MLLVDFQKHVNDPKYQIKKQSDFDILNKYFQDLTDKSKDKISKMAIEYWNKKKLKIINQLDLQILAHYIDYFFGYTQQNDINKNENENENIKNIKVAGKYEFTYIEYDGDDIRQENIFKLNFYNIVEKLKQYFPQVNIKIDFEKSTYVDRQIKKANTTYKHDVIITLTPKSDENLEENSDYDPEKSFEIVLEYFEKIHNRFNDEDKKISTNLFSDEYFVFDVNKDNMENFMIDTIYGIIQTICACTNDEYELSKILYFNKNYTNRNLIRQVEYFNEIILIQKNNKFNLDDFYNRITPRDPDTEKKITKKKFIKLLEDICELEFDNDDNIYDSTTFEKIIMYLDNNKITSERILSYKNLYCYAMKSLLKANKKIIDILQKQRSKRMQLPKFIKNFQKFHKDNLKI
jgi:hypothetical protein